MRPIIKILFLSICLFGGALADAYHEKLSPLGTLDATDPSLTIISPIQNDTILYGNIIEIQWLAEDSSFSEKPIAIAYQILPSDQIITIIDFTENDGQYTWSVPENVNGPVQLRISARDQFGNTTSHYSSILYIIGLNSGPSWYVAQSGNDDRYNGTSAFPYKTIQKAFSSAKSGDTIFVAPGSYSGNLDDFGKHLTVINLSMTENVTITGATGAASLVLNGNSVIKNLRFMGPGSNGNTDGILIANGQAKISGCYLTGFRTGIVCTGGSRTTLDHNLVTNCDIGIICQEQTSASIINNSIVSNVGGILITGYQDTCLIKNNIIALNNAKFGINTSVNFNHIGLHFNNIWNNQPANYNGLPDLTGSCGNISDDPLFRDIISGDFHLQAHSTSINAGDPTSDYQLEPEPNGDRINLGIYGGTPNAEIAALSFIKNPNILVKEDSLYYQNLGIQPDNGVLFEYVPFILPPWLTLEPRSGAIYGTPHNGHVGQHRIKIMVSDNYDRADTLDYSLTVINTLPYFSSLPDSICLEDQLWQYDANTSDEGQGDCRYTILEPDWLQIDTLSGVVSGVPTNDQVGNNQVTIQFNDGNGGIIWQRFNLEVINVNDAPILKPLPPVFTQEDQSVTIYFANYKQYASDVDNSVDSLTWQVYNSANATVINYLNSAIITPKKDWFGSEMMEVVISDGALTDTNHFTLNVAPVNDPPVWNLPDEKNILSTDSLRLFLPSFVTDIDDPKNDLRFTIQPAFNPLDYQISITLTTDNYFVVQPSIRTELNREKIYFMVSDTSQATASDSLFLTVYKINFPPQLSALPDIVGREDTTLRYDIHSWRNYVSDPDDDVALLGWQVFRSVHIDAVLDNNTLTLNPIKDWYGEELLPLIVYDEQDTAFGSVKVVISNVPDAPTVLLPKNYVFNEDEELLVNLDELVNDIDSPDSLMTWSVSTDQPPTGFHYELNADRRQLRFKGDPNFYTDSVAVTYTVMDETGLTAIATNYVSILPVNDPPFLTAMLDTCFLEDEILIIPNQLWLERTIDPDNDRLDLTMTIKKDTGVVFYQYDQNTASHQFWSDRDVNGSGYFTVTISDPDYAKTTYSFTVNIIPLNDAPVIKAMADTCIAQDTPLHLALRSYTHDVDNDWSQLRWQFSSSIVQISYEAGSDTLTLIPPIGFVGYDTICITVSDPEGLTDSDSFCLRFKDTVPPTFTIGIFQNPIANQYLDLYFFPSEKISQVLGVYIGTESKNVTLLNSITPPPYHCTHKLSTSAVREVVITAKDTTENIGSTSYAFSASEIFAKLGGTVYSPDSAFALIIPPKALNSNGFILCLPNASESAEVTEHKNVTLAKPRNSSVVKSCTFQSTMVLHEMVKLQFHSEAGINSTARKHIGIARIINGQVLYQKTYTNSEASNYWTYIDQFGEYTIVYDAPEPPQVLPDKCVLMQNYPNPFNPITQITFTLPELVGNKFAHRARLVVYDLLGREVARLFDEICTPGVYHLSWNGHNSAGVPLASGVYFYTLEYGNFLKSRKMVLIK